MKKIDHKIFIRMLKEKGITQKAFANYSKIPYDTVTGWKKRGSVPLYAMVIARDMAYRLELNENAQKELQRKYKRQNNKIKGLNKKEQKLIESAFWGTNYTAAEIIKKAQNKDEEIIKQIKNLPINLQEKIATIQVNPNV